MNKILTDVLYTLVNINLLNTIRLVRKYIKVYLRVILKTIILVKDNDILDYINIKNNLYFLRILDENPNPNRK